MSENKDEKKPVGQLPFSDKVVARHTRKTEQGDIISSETHEASPQEASLLTEVTKIAEKRFCMECGEGLTPLLIYYCKACKQRYLVQYDEIVGRPLIVPIGKEEIEEE